MYTMATALRPCIRNTAPGLATYTFETPYSKGLQEFPTWKPWLDSSDAENIFFARSASLRTCMFMKIHAMVDSWSVSITEQLEKVLVAMPELGAAYGPGGIAVTVGRYSGPQLKSAALAAVCKGWESQQAGRCILALERQQTTRPSR